MGESDAPDGTADIQDSQQAEQSAGADNKVSVFVRISPSANRILKSAATGGRTKAAVLEALLKNLAEEEDPSVREKILDRAIRKPLEEQGELLEWRSWAEHAFENDRYFWAAIMYKRLVNHSSSSVGLKNICHYRLSLCLIRLSYIVRAEALKGSVDQKLFGRALKTLDKAIFYTNAVAAHLSDKLLFPRLVLYYNLASCRSLKAQYLVESKLGPSDPAVIKLRDLAGKEGTGELTEAVWEGLGQTWRSNQNEREVDAEAEKAFRELQKILPSGDQEPLGAGTDGAEDDRLRSERLWMAEAAMKDTDFMGEPVHSLPMGGRLMGARRGGAAAGSDASTCASASGKISI
ncbi:MAG: hypothetical protein LC795_07610 [Acidobacteria bacterium]|nr:hypothetical protein [Acidobacteriota bacterium]